LRTVAVVSLKGGSGKTTIATHLALAAHLRGIDVLVADIDAQRSAYDILTTRETPGPQCVATTGAKVMAAQFAAVGTGKALMVIDTAAGAIEDATEALVLADLAVMVVRPTLLDLAGLARTLRIVRQLGKRSVVVINQAGVPRESHEPPMVKRALRALEYMRAETAPVVIRSRTVYQLALEKGRSAEEMGDGAALSEIGALWDYVNGLLTGRSEAGESPLEPEAQGRDQA
jgi:chromosome partitioning protein